MKINKIKSTFLPQQLYNKEYRYFVIKLKPNKDYEIDINIGSIAILNFKEKNAKLKINKREYRATLYKFFRFQNKKIKFSSKSEMQIVFSGVNQKIKQSYLKKFKEKDIYKVKKPWGYELWVNGRKSKYSFKKIYLKKKNQTSLQFHKKKIETNFLYKGEAELTLSKKNGKDLKEDVLKNVYKKKIKAGTYLNVNNYVIHRLKALTDIILYEVSTPHLDDVIRLADDKNRKDGLIASEHH